MKLENYKGSISLISGIIQANNGEFALMQASAIQTREDGTRLDAELDIDYEKYIAFDTSMIIGTGQLEAPVIYLLNGFAQLDTPIIHLEDSVIKLDKPNIYLDENKLEVPIIYLYEKKLDAPSIYLKEEKLDAPNIYLFTQKLDTPQIYIDAPLSLRAPTIYLKGDGAALLGQAMLGEIVVGE